MDQTNLRSTFFAHIHTYIHTYQNTITMIYLPRCNLFSTFSDDPEKLHYEVATTPITCPTHPGLPSPHIPITPAAGDTQSCEGRCHLSFPKFRSHHDTRRASHQARPHNRSEVPACRPSGVTLNIPRGIIQFSFPLSGCTSYEIISLWYDYSAFGTYVHHHIITIIIIRRGCTGPHRRQ